MRSNWLRTILDDIAEITAVDNFSIRVSAGSCISCPTVYERLPYVASGSSSSVARQTAKRIAPLPRPVFLPQGDQQILLGRCSFLGLRLSVGRLSPALAQCDRPAPSPSCLACGARGSAR